MRGLVTCALIVSAGMLGCGDDAAPPDSGPTDAGSRDAGSTDAGRRDAGAADAGTPDAGTDAAGRDAGSPVTFEVDVVAYFVVTYPLEGALVRVDDALGGTRTLGTDADGHVVFELPEGSSPWNVTAAMPGFTATSVIGVTGPLDDPIHLGGAGARDTFPVGVVRRTVSGSISGRTLTEDNTVFVTGLVRDAMVDHAADTWTAQMNDFPDAPSLRLLALEWMDGPVNAVWLDVDRTGEDVTGVDIAFPDPPRSTTTTTMTLNLPTAGFVMADGFVPHMNGDRTALRRVGRIDYPVGLGDIEPVADGTTTWTIDALDGDMAPTLALLDLAESADPGPSYRHVLVTAEVAADAVIDVPEVEDIDRGGVDLETIGPIVRAPEYAHAGMSIVGDGNGWFFYSYEGAEWDGIDLPELPEGMSFADLGHTVPTGTRHIFCLTWAESTKPWNWSQLGALRAVLLTEPMDLPAP